MSWSVIGGQKAFLKGKNTLAVPSWIRLLDPTKRRNSMSDDDKFDLWLNTLEGQSSSRTDILYRENMEPIYIKRLKAAFMAGLKGGGE